MDIKNPTKPGQAPSAAFIKNGAILVVSIAVVAFLLGRSPADDRADKVERAISAAPKPKTVLLPAGASVVTNRKMVGCRSQNNLRKLSNLLQDGRLDDAEAFIGDNECWTFPAGEHGMVWFDNAALGADLRCVKTEMASLDGCYWLPTIALRHD